MDENCTIKSDINHASSKPDLTVGDIAPSVTLTTEGKIIASDSSTQPLSKKAQKKAAKAAYIAEKKLERRAREKAAKKEKRAEKRAMASTGNLDSEDHEPEKKRLRKDESTKPFNARVVVDLGFDDLMTDKEVASLCSQLAYTYNANRKANRPFASLLFTALNGRTKKRLDSQNDASYRRWANTEWWEGGYEGLWLNNSEDVEQQDDKEGLSDNNDCRSKSDKANVVYLTADSSEELNELKEDETYVLGGICDHNRYKNLCYKKATSGGIRTARLPIGTYLSEMKTRKILTVNQVFEILVHWTEHRNWEEALYSVIPKRKFQQQTKSQLVTEGEQLSDKESVAIDPPEIQSDQIEAVSS